MSTYTDYESVSKNYDKTRVPFGSETIINTLTSATGKPLAELHVLDAGCGTGNYALELLKAGLCKISMYDASSAMLDQARAKLNSYCVDGRIVTMKQGLLPSLPFGPGTFDAVMFNMVLHHLVDEHIEDKAVRFKAISAVFEEVFRVLKPGGVLVVTTCLPEQYPAIWYANISPGVTDRMAKRFPSSDEIMDMLSKLGFIDISIQSLLGAGWTNHYWIAQGPLNREWRDLDSYWSIFSEEELSKVVEKTEAMKARGALNQFMLDNDASNSVGHFTLVGAVKSNL